MWELLQLNTSWKEFKKNSMEAPGNQPDRFRWAVSDKEILLLVELVAKQWNWRYHLQKCLQYKQKRWKYRDETEAVFSFILKCAFHMERLKKKYCTKRDAAEEHLSHSTNPDFLSSYYHTHAASVSSSKVVKTRIRRGKNYTLPKQVPVKLKPAAGYLEFGLKAGNRREQMKQYQCCCFSSAFIKFKWDSLNLKPGRQAVSFLLFPFFTALGVASYLPYHSPLKSGRHGGKKAHFPKFPAL